HVNAYGGVVTPPINSPFSNNATWLTVVPLPRTLALRRMLTGAVNEDPSVGLESAIVGGVTGGATCSANQPAIKLCTLVVGWSLSQYTELLPGPVKLLSVSAGSFNAPMRF